MNTIIGITDRNLEVRFGDPVNFHILALGASGTGKSTCQIGNLLQTACQGVTSLVINWKGSAADGMLHFTQEARFRKLSKHIDAANDGIPIPLFSKFTLPNGKRESDSQLKGRITSLLAKSAGLAPTEELCLIDAVKTVLEESTYQAEGIQAVRKVLLSQETNRSSSAAIKLRAFFDTNILFDGALFDNDIPIIDLDLNGLEYEHQKVMVNFILDYILRLSQKGVFIKKGLTIFIDEAQNLEYTPQSPIYSLINESRKQNVQLLLAAPSLNAGNKRGMSIVQQCGTILYFKPISSELDKIAGAIDPNRKAYWSGHLSNLKRGQFIAVGDFLMDNRLISKPLVLRTYLIN